MANVIALMGPTAAGKTALAMHLCEHFDFDIISVDSALVYKGMDIGTAKPSASELRLAPHRLIDIRDTADNYSAGQFRRDALHEIDSIHAAKRVPLLAGGTMLYFRALFNGINQMPDADVAIRARLDSEAAVDGWPALHERLAGIDPAAAQRIHRNDSQRIQRALEVYEKSGVTLSAWQAVNPGDAFTHRLLKIALIPPDRTVLHERIAQRFKQMLDEGVVDEVRSLFERGDLTAQHSSMRAVGYRQLWQYLSGEMPLQRAIDDAVTATRRLAKRQLTWLRSEPDLVLVDPLQSAAHERLRMYVERWLNAAI